MHQRIQPKMKSTHGTLAARAYSFYNLLRWVAEDVGAFEEEVGFRVAVVAFRSSVEVTI